MFTLLTKPGQYRTLQKPSSQWMRQPENITKIYVVGQNFFMSKNYYIKKRFLATILQNDRVQRSLDRLYAKVTTVEPG